MKITYYGHSCFSVEIAGKTLLFDPFITPNELAKNIRLEDLKADYILVSHGHGDHIHDAAQVAALTGAPVVAAFEVASWLEKQGVKKVHPMNLGGGLNLDFGRVKFVNAIHSSNLPDGSYGGNPGGFVVSSGNDAFYYAGDTALTLDMKLIPEEVSLRFAVLPIGDNFTMGARDAARAAKLLDCKEILGVHYDTFPPIKIDREAARETFRQAGIRLHLLAIGAAIDL